MLFLLFLQGGRPLQVHPCVGALALWRARRELLAGTWVHPVGHRHGSVARIVGRARGWESGGRSHGGREISPRQRRDIRADERIMGGERFIIIIYLFKLFDLCVIIYNYSKSCSSSLRENEQELNSMIEKNPLLHELLRPLTNEKKERKKKGNPITRVIRFIENLFIP